MTRPTQCAAPAMLPTGRPHGGRTHPDAHVTITRVWAPADGPDALAEIVRSVVAAGGTLVARIPAVFISVEELHAAGARAAPLERVA